MKVGEVWILNAPPNLPFEFRGGVIKITRLYRDDVEMQDYVDYKVIYSRDDEKYIEKYNINATTGGGMTREELLKFYIKKP